MLAIKPAGPLPRYIERGAPTDSSFLVLSKMDSIPRAWHSGLREMLRDFDCEPREWCGGRSGPEHCGCSWRIRPPGCVAGRLGLDNECQIYSVVYHLDERDLYVEDLSETRSQGNHDRCRRVLLHFRRRLVATGDRSTRERSRRSLGARRPADTGMHPGRHRTRTHGRLLEPSHLPRLPGPCA